MWDRTTVGVSRYERPLRDDIDLIALFAEREGHCFVPKGHQEHGRLLNVTKLAFLWASSELAEDVAARLESIPGWKAAARELASEIRLAPDLVKSQRNHERCRQARIEENRRRALENRD